MLNYHQFKKNRPLIIFWMLLIVFLIVISILFLPVFENILSGTFMIISGSIQTILGGLLVLFTLRQKVEKKLKSFLLLTGASGTGFFIFIFLHNLFYGLSSITKGVVFLSQLFNIFEIGFFLLAIIVCPIVFLVGMIGSIFNNVGGIHR